MKPRILMIISFFYPHLGGTEQQALRLAEHLVKRGIPVCVLTRKFKGIPAHEVIQGIPVCRSIYTLPWGKWFAVTYMLSVFWFLLRKRHTYDIIHCHLLQGFHSVVAVVVKALFGKKVIIKVGATGLLSDFLMMREVFGGDFLLKKIKRVDKLITVCSQSTAEALQHGFAARQIVQIPNGVDTNQFQPCLSSDNRSSITFVGRLDHMKGVHILLEACKKLKEEGLNPPVSIVGDGPEREALKNFAMRSGLADVVNFHGEIADIRPFLKRSAMFVLPSFSEGLSNVLLEAMACGLPVIATRVGGNMDLIRDGENGILVDSANAEQLFEAIKTVLQDKNLAEKLGKKARKTVEQKFSMEAITDHYVLLYNELRDSNIS